MALLCIYTVRVHLWQTLSHHVHDVLQSSKHCIIMHLHGKDSSSASPFLSIHGCSQKSNGHLWVAPCDPPQAAEPPVCVRVCVCMYVFMYVWVEWRLGILRHVTPRRLQNLLCVYVCVCMYVCMYDWNKTFFRLQSNNDTWFPAGLLKLVYVCMHIHIHIHVHATIIADRNMLLLAHAYMHTCILIRKHIHAYKYTCTYTYR